MNFRQELENSKMYDIKAELRNLSYEALLNLATGQKMLIEDYEEGLKNRTFELDDLKEAISTIEENRRELEFLSETIKKANNDIDVIELAQPLIDDYQNEINELKSKFTI